MCFYLRGKPVRVISSANLTDPLESDGSTIVLDSDTTDATWTPGPEVSGDTGAIFIRTNFVKKRLKRVQPSIIKRRTKFVKIINFLKKGGGTLAAEFASNSSIKYKNFFIYKLWKSALWQKLDLNLTSRPYSISRQIFPAVFI